MKDKAYMRAALTVEQRRAAAARGEAERLRADAQARAEAVRLVAAREVAHVRAECGAVLWGVGEALTGRRDDVRRAIDGLRDTLDVLVSGVTAAVAAMPATVDAGTVGDAILWAEHVHAESAILRATLAERDATIERLQAEARAASLVPPAPPGWVRRVDLQALAGAPRSVEADDRRIGAVYALGIRVLRWAHESRSAAPPEPVDVETAAEAAP